MLLERISSVARNDKPLCAVDLPVPDTPAEYMKVGEDYAFPIPECFSDEGAVAKRL